MVINFIKPRYQLIALLLVASCAGPEKVTGPSKPPVATVGEVERLESTYHLIEGIRQRNLGNWQQSVIEHLAAAKKDPTNDAAYYELAKAHLVQGQYLDAIKFVIQAQEIDPKNFHYSLLLADLHLLTQNPKEAIIAFLKLLNHNPGNPDIMQRLANAYIFAERPAEALNIIERLEKQGFATEMITVQKLRLLMKLGRTREAIAEAERVVSIFPDETLFIETLADLYFDTGQQQRALDVIQQYYNNNPENADAIFMLADHYQKTEDWEKVLSLLGGAFHIPSVETAEKERILYVLYYLVEEKPEYLQPTIDLARMFVDQNPTYAQAYNIYGDLLRQAHRNQESRDAYKKSTQLDPSNLVVWQQLIFAEMRLKNFTSMAQYATQATEMFFEQPLPFLLLAHANSMLKNYPKALEALKKGLPLVQDNNDLRLEFIIMIADVNHYLGNHRESDRNYDLALSINPNNAGALNNYAYMLSQRGQRLQDALKMATKAISLSPGNAAFEDTMGWIYFNLGEYQNAKEWIEKAINNSNEPSSTAYEHMGDVLYKLGQKDKALQYWNKAESIGDGSDLLPKKIRDKTYYDE